MSAGKQDKQWDDGLGDLPLAGGPWTPENAPEDPTIDFGHLRVPLRDGLQARVEIDPAVGAVGAVSVKVGTGEVQLKVIAAPRGQPYWSALRRVIVQRLRSRGSHPTVVEGRFGPEIVVTMTGRGPDGGRVEAPTRFVGAEGDRWVLRATVTGEDVTGDPMVERVDAFLSACVVDRGTVAAPAGAVLPLTPPPGEPGEEWERLRGEGS